MVPSDTMFFVQFMTMQESEAILRKGCWNLKRKFGVTMNFSKIDKLWGKMLYMSICFCCCCFCHRLLCTLKVFRVIFV